MLILQNISYQLPNKDLLFENISFSLIKHEKIALIGHNGVGKSSLLKIISKEFFPNDGLMKLESEPYSVPQQFGQFDDLTIAGALKVETKINALKEILNGHVTEKFLNDLNDDWPIEDRCREALEYWDLIGLDLNQKLKNLSGGQKTKIFLAGIQIHQPELILMDEPSNHLDSYGRKQLYEFIQSTNSSLIVVSHDRKLLNHLNGIYELSPNGIKIYGGNYEFYKEQKQIENNALSNDIQSKEKALKKAKQKERETLERKQKLDARGKRQQEKSGTARIMMNTLRNNAENSASKLKNVHTEKIENISHELRELRSSQSGFEQMKFGLDSSSLHKGKILFAASDLNFGYDEKFIWKENLDFQILSGERVVVRGINGSGKTTLIKLILGSLAPQTGQMLRVENRSVYIDQDYSLIDDKKSVYEQAQHSNQSGMEEHEVKIRLNRFLFPKEDWDKPCAALSGGERMRLLLCCLTINSQSPDVIVLDEPTNNLDLQNIEILTAAINEYRGTLLVVSHDVCFLEQIKVERAIELRN